MTAQPANRNPRPNTDQEMLTLQEACAYLRLPEGTLRYWRHLGSGPKSFKVGRHVRYWKTDLILWLSEQTNAHSPQNPQVSPQGNRFDSRNHPTYGRG